MKVRDLLGLMIIAASILLLGCAPQQPPISIPPQPTYEYKQTIIDTSKTCRPSANDELTMLKLYYVLTVPSVTVVNPQQQKPSACSGNNFIDLIACGNPNNGGPQPGPDLTGRYTKDIGAFRSILLCTQTNLETDLDKQTVEGWFATSIQPMNSGPYELGIQYSFIVSLTRQK